LIAPEGGVHGAVRSSSAESIVSASTAAAVMPVGAPQMNPFRGSTSAVVVSAASNAADPSAEQIDVNRSAESPHRVGARAADCNGKSV
jgi:hypothetical protein